jgi:tetratricopeptide (TPR) repeat protein
VIKSVRNPWLISPWMDVCFFIAPPLFIIPAFQVLSALISLASLKFAVLSLSATGHHLPGFIRAYTDPAIFKTFRARLLVVPALIILFAAVAAYYKLSLIFFVLIAWGTWHGILQIHGFLRIYDAKAGFHSAFQARLDFWMCLTWFVQVILWSSGKKISLLGSFYLAGGPLFPAGPARVLETGWLALTAVVSVVYLGSILHGVRHRHFNPRKLACLAISFAFWAYCMLSVGNLVIGLLLWEIFHDIQYNAFVWSYNHGRVKQDLSGSRLERFLFRPNWQRVAIYAACIVAYGCIGFLSQDVLNIYENKSAYESVIRQIGNVFACSALIHFYLDGFIWKLRDVKVRRDMGVGVDAGEAPRAASGVRHWVLVAVFFTAAFGLAASERFHWSDAERHNQYSNLVELVPNSGYAQFMRASELRAQGDAKAARGHYLRAIEMDTNYAFTRAFVADLEYRMGDTAAAIASYEKARAQDPGDATVLGNLANLYASTGQVEQARVAFEQLVAVEPSNAEAHYGLAFALLQLRRGLDAKPHLERTLALDSAQPLALNYLGMVEQATGNPARAESLYRKALQLAPDYAHARQNLEALGGGK